MKAKINISFLFSIVVLCEIYITSFRINFLIESVFLLFLITVGSRVVSKQFLKTILPVIVVFFIGFIGVFFDRYGLVNIIKDITHFSKPIIVMCIGYLTFRALGDVSVFLKTIVQIALFTAIVHLIGVFGFSNLVSGGPISDSREFGLDNFIEIFALYFIILAPKHNVVLFKKRLYTNVAIAVLLLSIVMYFSRTMLGMILILGLSFYGYGKFTRKSLKLTGVLLLVLFLFYGYLGTIKLERNAKGLESLLYKIKIAPSEIVNAKIDRENHRDLWDHWRAYEAKRALNLMNNNPSSYLIGSGYGSLVNLKFKAPLGENGMRYISVLHNGYIFVLYKTGIFGILFYLTFLISLYLRAYHSDGNKFFKTLISTIGIYFLLTSIIITGIYIPKDAILFVLGGALFFENKIQ